jgi:hypothetical protein
MLTGSVVLPAGGERVTEMGGVHGRQDRRLSGGALSELLCRLTRKARPMFFAKWLQRLFHCAPAEIVIEAPNCTAAIHGIAALGDTLDRSKNTFFFFRR